MTLLRSKYKHLHFSKLTEEISHTSHLRNELRQVQEAMERKALEMESVQENLKRNKSQYVQLQNTLQDNEALIKQLSGKVNELEKVPFKIPHLFTNTFFKC